MKDMSSLLESEVFFSMTEVDTNIPKISSKNANIETGITEDNQFQIFVYYQFNKKQTSKLG